jgi:hypothetical protein
MLDRFHRANLFVGIAAIPLWIAGLAVSHGMSSKIPSHPTDQQLLAWIQHNTNTVLLGCWLFMVGCLCFLWFVGTLRGHLAAAEGGTGTLSSLALAGGAAAALCGMLTVAGDIGVAINKDSVSAATAGTLHNSGDMFFICAELAAMLFVVAVAAVAFRTAVLPKWWAIFSTLLAIDLLIGPIGWIGLIFGIPVWTIGTILILTLRRGPAQHRAQAPATA